MPSFLPLRKYIHRLWKLPDLLARFRSRANSNCVQFEGKVLSIARVHHYGLHDHVSRGGLEALYSERRSLGINNAVMIIVRNTVLHLLRKNLMD
ncbi:phage virion morphogenesis protein [Enterobacter vonholyi]